MLLSRIFNYRWWTHWNWEYFSAPTYRCLHPGSSSPAIDAGNPDLDGDGNDYLTDSDDQDPDGTRLDIGAYYYQQGPIVNYNSSNSQEL